MKKDFVDMTDCFLFVHLAAPKYVYESGRFCTWRKSLAKAGFSGCCLLGLLLSSGTSSGTNKWCKFDEIGAFFHEIVLEEDISKGNDIGTWRNLLVTSRGRWLSSQGLP